jgi:hypothetical protein
MIMSKCYFSLHEGSSYKKHEENLKIICILFMSDMSNFSSEFQLNVLIDLQNTYTNLKPHAVDTQHDWLALSR